ncbi:hypothetical protein DCC62_03065 [candidate division KSB1 bacterium]|nr:MAG: hypothetical protein DCC62_03065 [candidate division KSB1 bacterium]
MAETKLESKKTAYERICASHDQIADFRAKLLASLPIATGAGIFFLFSDKKPADELSVHLFPVGIFGALITIGLFFYELRGIQKCRGLIACAKRLEKELVPDLWQYGAFNFRQKAALGGFLGAAGAALVIYPTVMSGWIYVSAVGLINSGRLNTSALWFFMISWLASFILGVWVNNWQKRNLKVTVDELESKAKETKQ